MNVFAFAYGVCIQISSAALCVVCCSMEVAMRLCMCCMCPKKWSCARPRTRSAALWVHMRPGKAFKDLYMRYAFPRRENQVLVHTCGTRMHTLVGAHTRNTHTWRVVCDLGVVQAHQLPLLGTFLKCGLQMFPQGCALAGRARETRTRSAHSAGLEAGFSFCAGANALKSVAPRYTNTHRVNDFRVGGSVCVCQVPEREAVQCCRQLHVEVPLCHVHARTFQTHRHHPRGPRLL